MATKSASSVAQSTSSSRSSDKQDGKASNLRRMPRTIAGKGTAVEDAQRKVTLALYESALKLMQSGKYEKAHAAFTQMLQTAPHDLADRIRMYIAACVAQIDKGTTKFESHEERYDYAISLLNQGHYEDARQHFEQILRENDSADYAFYGLALLASMTGDTQQCIDRLTEAIRLNTQNRFQARADSDFEPVADDPRFTELLYPEA
ncbi:MAG TPA: tetratricopeptide repeat protein [Acidobacteriaceae bacterium]|jgi:tetratricopeptide (TPR) repeat protein|nr:tetratricopeptide repeat protein [Acidobacteriaceae bacterium]